MMMHFDQRGLCVAEKIGAQESRHGTTHSRRKIGSLCSGMVAGTLPVVAMS